MATKMEQVLAAQTRVGTIRRTIATYKALYKEDGTVDEADLAELDAMLNDAKLISAKLSRAKQKLETSKVTSEVEVQEEEVMVKSGGENVVQEEMMPEKSGSEEVVELNEFVIWTKEFNKRFDNRDITTINFIGISSDSVTQVDSKYSLVVVDIKVTVETNQGYGATTMERLTDLYEPEYIMDGNIANIDAMKKSEHAVKVLNDTKLEGQIKSILYEVSIKIPEEAGIIVNFD